MCEMFEKVFGDDYYVVMNFVFDMLEWFEGLGGVLMKLGFDFCGGVYFLMEVDMIEVIVKLLEDVEGGFCILLCEEGICYCGVK